MPKELFIASMGLALFIVCPRMAGMVHIIAKHSQAHLFYTALYGTIFAIPLVLIMVLVFTKFGVWGALAFCVLTDIMSALFMKEISLRAGIETIVVALFVILGVKLAPYVANIFII